MSEDIAATDTSRDAQSATFQRARRPEQREARRQAILDVAEAMLAQDPTAEISLREISRRVGLATSNVLRYFESREAIFLELLAGESTSWLDALEQEPLFKQQFGVQINPIDSLAKTELDDIISNAKARIIMRQQLKRMGMGQLAAMQGLEGQAGEPGRRAGADHPTA